MEDVDSESLSGNLPNPDVKDKSCLSVWLDVTVFGGFNIEQQVFCANAMRLADVSTLARSCNNSAVSNHE